jgi:hypothetical protein
LRDRKKGNFFRFSFGECFKLASFITRKYSSKKAEQIFGHFSWASFEVEEKQLTKLFS